MNNIKKAMDHLNRSMEEWEQRSPIPFEEFLEALSAKPSVLLRSVFQMFHDMIKTFIDDGHDEYPDDPESISYVRYNCSRLFIDGLDHPFFADRLFANRLVNLVDAWKRGAQQNKIYIFEGPHGCGKSTFLNDLLAKFEQYANSEEGLRFETVWRLDKKIFGGSLDLEPNLIIQNVLQLLDNPDKGRAEFQNEKLLQDLPNGYIDVPCPSHDHPILMIPKGRRRAFLDVILENNDFKHNLVTEKGYDWVFRDNPCTICSSLYEALLNKLGNPQRVFEMLYARPYHFNRRLGEGISIFTPGDKPLKQHALSNDVLQRRINKLFKDSNQVKYMFSRYAKTNNGIYALMDIKSHNTERLIELHNVISEGVHKVEYIEENVNSFFLAVMNPEDKNSIKDFQSFSDRIEYIKISYIMDLNTEVELYRNVFGAQIDKSFLPMVLHNFARVIISSRLNIQSEALLEWIGDPAKYSLYCDKNLQLLKMEIYTGYIPPWLSEEDLKRLTAKRRRAIIAESEKEGVHGFSGRDSIKIFNDFYSTYAKDNKLINMHTLSSFFRSSQKGLSELIPDGFLDSLLHMYDYTVLQDVKESLYNYNEEQISKDIQNYLFSINFEIGAVETCKFTGEQIHITEEFFDNIETYLLGSHIDKDKRLSFRQDIQKEYTTETLTHDMMLQGIPITETKLYQSLHEKYVYNIKGKALDPFLENENFRQAIKDYSKETFKTYDKRIRNDVSFLMKNLSKNFNYTERGAKEVCIYVIDNDLPKKFGNP